MAVSTSSCETSRPDTRFPHRECHAPVSGLDKQLRRPFASALELEMVLRRSGIHRRSVHLAGAGWSGVPPIVETEAATRSLVRTGIHPHLPCDEGHLTTGNRKSSSVARD